MNVYECTLVLVGGTAETHAVGAAIDLQVERVIGTQTVGGSGIADGDKGDITVSGSGTVWTIDQNAVTEGKIATGAVTETKLGARSVTAAKLFQVGHGKLIGRHGAGDGDAQEIGLDGGLEFQGGNIRREALTGDVTAPAGGNALTITPAANPTWITALAWTKLTGVPDFVPKQRYRTLWIGAGAMTPPNTGGAAAATIQTTTNGVSYDVFKFDGATAESAWFNLRMPDEWDRGTLKVIFHWEPDPSGSGAVVWGVAGIADSNDDAIDSAVGTEVTVADAVIAVGDLHVTAATASMTVGGSPALGDVITFRIRRLPADAGDTMTQDAYLLGVAIQWREGTTEPAAW